MATEFVPATSVPPFGSPRSRLYAKGSLPRGGGDVSGVSAPSPSRGVELNSLQPFVVLFPLAHQRIVVLLPHQTLKEVVRTHDLANQRHLAPGGVWRCLAADISA